MTNEGDLSIPQAAAALGVSHTAINHMIERGDLEVARTVYHGRQRRRWVTRASVEAQQRQQEGTQETT